MMNRIRPAVGVCFALFVSLAAAAPEGTADEARLRQACASLLNAPQSVAELQVLLDVSRHATNSPDLRSRAMAAYALTWLMQGNTNAYDRAVQVIKATYPDAATLLTVGDRDCFATCADCAGAGVQTTACPSCMSSGKCKACAGSGKKDGSACPACKGKGVCAMCAGKQKIEIPCPTCKGTGLTFKPSEKIRGNFGAILTNIVSLCESNARFAEQFALASKETDSAKRIERFKKLLNDFPDRSDLAEAKQCLGVAVAQRDKREAQLQKQKALEQAAREVDELRTLRDAVNLDDAIARLTAYLRTHPDSDAQPELQALRDELIAKRNRSALTKKIFCVAGALLGVLVVVSCTAPFFFRRKPQRSGPLPGMDKLDEAKFTDPLSLNAQDSQQRTKSKPGDNG